MNYIDQVVLDYFNSDSEVKLSQPEMANFSFEKFSVDRTKLRLKEKLGKMEMYQSSKDNWLSDENLRNMIDNKNLMIKLNKPVKFEENLFPDTMLRKQLANLTYLKISKIGY